jgi:hypothetical protein
MLCGICGISVWKGGDMQLKLFAIAACALLAVTTAQAAESCDYANTKGEEITFRPAFPGGEKYGYQLWYHQPDNMGEHLTYEPYVGRKGKVVDGVLSDRFGISQYKKIVLENCEAVYANLISGEMPNDIYGALDVDIAKLLIGKKIWVNQSFGVPLELVTLDKAVSYPMHHLEAMTVTDLYYPGIGHARGSAPFFLKVRKETGEEGFFPFSTRYFYPSDPMPPGTPAKFADAIRQQKIVLGMTAPQVLLSWGKPEDINRSVGSWGVHEQWVYGNQYVYLENGKVDSFQD